MALRLEVTRVKVTCHIWYACWTINAHYILVYIRKAYNPRGCDYVLVLMTAAFLALNTESSSSHFWFCLMTCCFWILFSSDWNVSLWAAVRIPPWIRAFLGVLERQISQWPKLHQIVIQLGLISHVLGTDQNTNNKSTLKPIPKHTVVLLENLVIFIPRHSVIVIITLYFSARWWRRIRRFC